MGEDKQLSEDDEEELWGHFIRAVHETTGISHSSQNTRKQLQRNSEWKEWLAAEHKQLNGMHAMEMHVTPVERSSLPKGSII